MVPESRQHKSDKEPNYGRNTYELTKSVTLLLQKILSKVTRPLIKMQREVLLQIMKPSP